MSDSVEWFPVRQQDAQRPVPQPWGVVHPALSIVRARLDGEGLRDEHQSRAAHQPAARQEHS